MTGMEDVVTTLDQAVKKVDDTRLEFSQAEGYLNRAGDNYEEASKGSVRPQPRQALGHIRAAQAEARRVLALITDGVTAIRSYINDVSPGFASGGSSDVSEPVSGESLVTDAPKSRWGRVHDLATKEADGLARDTGKYAHEIRNSLLREGYGNVPVSQCLAYTESIRPAPVYASPEQSASAFAAMSIFAADLILRAKRKVKSRHDEHSQESHRGSGKR